MSQILVFLSKNVHIVLLLKYNLFMQDLFFSCKGYFYDVVLLLLLKVNDLSTLNNMLLTK